MLGIKKLAKNISIRLQQRFNKSFERDKVRQYKCENTK